MNSGSRLIWIGMMECLDHVRCIREVFGWFPTCCVRGIVKPFPLHEIQQTCPLAMPIDPAVKDPMNFPLVGIVQLDQWWWVYDLLGISLDLVDCSSDT